MRTRNPAKLTVLAAIALLGAAAGLNCSESSILGDSGDLRIAFEIPDGIHLTSVHYAMTLNGASGPSGIFNTGEQNASPSFDLALPPSTNDTITLTATTDNNVGCTSGPSPPFDIVSTAQTTVRLPLLCGSGSPTTVTGPVDVRATVTVLSVP